MRPRAEDLARENCTKGGCAHVSSGGQECKHCGFDAEELARRKSLPLVELPNGLLGKVVQRETELRGEWLLACEAPLYYFVCSVCGAKAKDQLHGDDVCCGCGAKMKIRWMREEWSNAGEASGKIIDELWHKPQRSESEHAYIEEHDEFCQGDDSVCNSCLPPARD